MSEKKAEKIEENNIKVLEEHEHLINILEKAKKAAAKEDVVELRQLSDQTTHSTSIYQEDEYILVAVIIYSLGKIIEKGRKYYKEDYEMYFKDYLKIIDQSISLLKKSKYKEFREQISLMLKSTDISGELKQHLEGLFRKARINKASNVYEHGISMEKTAKLLGISMWELAEYSGQTPISEYSLGKTIPVKERIKNAMEMFR